jgi:hypothetical protein
MTLHHESDPWANDLDPYPEPDPYADRTHIPYSDPACRALLDQLVHSLITIRGGATLDPGAQLSVLASIHAETTQRVPHTVWIARYHHGYTWPQIARRMGLTTKIARNRYSTYIPTRPHHP